MNIDLIIVALTFGFVIWLYFKRNPLNHSKAFMWRRFVNWFPLGMTYAFLYMARYNLTVAKNALGSAMTVSEFGLIFGCGTAVYASSFLLNGPLVDRIGGKKGILIAALGASVTNMVMGLVTYLFIQGKLHVSMVATFCVLYSINMFFQSYGAVSIIKVKAYWFHVRERGMFGSIFGTLLGAGIYFAIDWGQSIADASKATLSGAPTTLQTIFRYVFGIENGGKDAIWLVFFIPAFILILWAIIDLFLIKDTPGEANFEDFDTHDASSGEDDAPIPAMVVLKKILTNPILLTIAAIEFMGGVLRNGIVNFYFIFAKAVPQVGAEYFKAHWGFLLFFTGSVGCLIVGWISDHYYHSRRGPPAAICMALIFVAALTMSLVLLTSPIAVAICAISISLLVISVHSLMSGTAAADFGGKKMTATASGITDGFTYLGSSLGSFAIGYLSMKSWSYWPIFLIPFPVIGFFLAWKIWHSMPAQTRKYLATVENVHIKVTGKDSTIQIDSETVTIRE